MPKIVTQYDILISCPGDITKEEIEVINRSIQRFNDLYTKSLGITLQSKHWSRNAFAQSGNKPQELLNEQFVNDCDAAIAIMWTRFGTPTDEYGSGTEEEIENMLAHKKQVFMYFSQKPIPPDKLNENEYKKVNAFKDKYKNRGLYYIYNSDEELESLFFAHLSQYFLTEKRISEIENSRKPKLVLRAIDKDGGLSDNFCIVPFKLNIDNPASTKLSEIQTIYSVITGINIDAEGSYVGNPKVERYIFAGYKPVSISSGAKELIRKFAEKIGFALPENFFSLGNLKENSLTVALGRSELIGTSEEKEKYQLINQLENSIIDYFKWLPVERGFQGFHCVRLALQNDGTDIDEDVEILLTFPKEELITIEEFPLLDNDVMRYLLNDCNMYDIFGICSTSSYMNYDESVVMPHGHPVTTYNPPFPGTTPDYSDDYIEELEDVFKYSVYEENGKRILRLKFEYIKHHTAIAFPSVIFVTEEEKNIPYSITSKHSADILTGVLHFQ